MAKYYHDDDSINSRGSNRSLFEKFLNMFGFEAEEIIEDEDAAAGEESYRKDSRERGKLLSLNNSSKPVRMVIIEPESFDEVQAIVDHLKNKRAVILNLDETDKAIARRIADFVGGAIYAMDGAMQRVNGSIFLFTPAHIEVAIPLRSELKEKERERSSTITGVNNSPFFRSDRER